MKTSTLLICIYSMIFSEVPYIEKTNFYMIYTYIDALHPHAAMLE